MYSPQALIIASGLTTLKIAASAGISVSTVQLSKLKNRWPAQARPRQALARALGLTVDPVTGHPLAAQVAP